MSRARYAQIEDWLRAKCDASPAGTLLPTDMEVAEQFAVSRMTARRAFDRLVHDGRIERRPGAGSFVRAADLHREGAVLRPFTDEMRRRGLTPSSTVLRSQIGPDPVAAQALGLPPSEWIVQIDRVRLADGAPVALEEVALPGQYAAVREIDLEHASLHAALADLGRTLHRATGYVSARLATPRDAEVLDLDLPAALLVENRVITDDAGRIVESTRSSYVASRWVIDTGASVSVSSAT